MNKSSLSSHPGPSLLTRVSQASVPCLALVVFQVFVLCQALVLCQAFVLVESAQARTPNPKTTRERIAALERLEVTPPGHVAPLSFGALFTADGAVGPDKITGFDGGFNVSDARLSLGGRLEAGFGYFINANLIQDTALLDLILDWKTEEYGFTAMAGFFRTPFSAELLIAAPNLDFIERSQIVRALAPARQIGVQLDQKLAGDELVAHFGIFNGNGFSTNDDERMLYTLRLDGVSRCACGSADANDDGADGSEFVYGVNVAYSEDDNARLGLDFPNPFVGKRLLSGADIRWTKGPVFVSAEALYGRISPRGPGGWRDVYGYQASIGWTINDYVQVLARYDALWAASLQTDRDLAIASLVLAFNEFVSIQTELRVPVRGDAPTPGAVSNITIQF